MLPVQIRDVCSRTRQAAKWAKWAKAKGVAPWNDSSSRDVSVEASRMKQHIMYIHTGTPYIV